MKGFFLGAALGFALSTFIQSWMRFPSSGGDGSDTNNLSHGVPLQPPERPSSASVPTTPPPPPTPSPTPPSLTFTEILQESGSDKYFSHHYERYYSSWLAPYRSLPKVKVLEIGAYTGKSLRVWDRYFTDPAMIMGLAYQGDGKKTYEQVKGYNDTAMHVYFGDQSKKETMDFLAEKGPWDVLIDDGSHVPQHMIFSFFSLWKSVRPGGVYIVEDLETNYWRHGREVYKYVLEHTGFGAEPEHSFVAKLLQIQQVMVRNQVNYEGMSVMEGDNDICSVEWGMNVVIVRKCEDDGKPKAKVRNNGAKWYWDDRNHTNYWLEEARRTNPF